MTASASDERACSHGTGNRASIPEWLMANEEPPAREPSPAGLPLEPEPEPALVDWWVWGVRKLASVAAELLALSRSLVVVFILVKIGTWLFTRSPIEVYQAVIGVAGFFAAWAMAIILGRFSIAHDTPDPERWLAQRRRR
jgi:hypothetical protein